MKITIQYNGQTWENVEVNATKWISPGAPDTLVAALKNAPRDGYVSGKRCPIVLGDKGKIYLGWSKLHNEEDEAYWKGNNAGTPKASSTKIMLPEDVARKTLAMEGLPEDVKKFYQDIVDEYDKERARKVENLVGIMKSLKKTDAQIKKALKALDIDWEPETAETVQEEK